MGKFILRIFKKKGFTLLEVMISLAILGIAGVVCLENYLINTRNLKIVNETEIALLLAESKIEEFKLNSLEKSGNFSSPYEDYSWEVSFSEISQVETEKERLKLKVGTLKIYWKTGQLKFLIPIIEENEK